MECYINALTYSQASSLTENTQLPLMNVATVYSFKYKDNLFDRSH